MVLPEIFGHYPQKNHFGHHSFHWRNFLCGQNWIYTSWKIVSRRFTSELIGSLPNWFHRQIVFGNEFAVWKSHILPIYSWNSISYSWERQFKKVWLQTKVFIFQQIVGFDFDEFHPKIMMCFFSFKGSSTTFRFSVFCRPVKISFSALIDEGAVAMATVVVEVLKANMGLMRWESLYAFMPTVLAYNVIKRLATTLAMPPLIPSPRRKLLWVLVTFLLKINLEKTETCLWPRVLLQESPSFLFIKSWDSEVAFFLKNRLLSRFLFALFATLLSFFWFFEVHLFVLLLAFERLYSLLSS